MLFLSRRLGPELARPARALVAGEQLCRVSRTCLAVIIRRDSLGSAAVTALISRRDSLLTQDLDYCLFHTRI